MAPTSASARAGLDRGAAAALADTMKAMRELLGALPARPSQHRHPEGDGPATNVSRPPAAEPSR